LTHTGHSLRYLLPQPTTASQYYNLRCTSTHNRQLPARTGHLTDSNFITRLLCKVCHWTFISMWLCILLDVSML